MKNSLELLLFCLDLKSLRSHQSSTDCSASLLPSFYTLTSCPKLLLPVVIFAFLQIFTHLTMCFLMTPYFSFRFFVYTWALAATIQYSRLQIFCIVSQGEKRTKRSLAVANFVVLIQRLSLATMAIPRFDTC